MEEYNTYIHTYVFVDLLVCISSSALLEMNEKMHKIYIGEVWSRESFSPFSCSPMLKACSFILRVERCVTERHLLNRSPSRIGRETKGQKGKGKKKGNCISGREWYG